MCASNMLTSPYFLSNTCITFFRKKSDYAGWRFAEVEVNIKKIKSKGVHLFCNVAKFRLPKCFHWVSLTLTIQNDIPLNFKVKCFLSLS